MHSFELSDYESKLAKCFEENHIHKEANKGAIGGHIDYVFTPNSIYRSVYLKCGVCGEKLNITDYNIW